MVDQIVVPASAIQLRLRYEEADVMDKARRERMSLSEVMDIFYARLPLCFHSTNEEGVLLQLRNWADDRLDHVWSAKFYARILSENPRDLISLLNYAMLFKRFQQFYESEAISRYALAIVDEEENLGGNCNKWVVAMLYLNMALSLSSLHFVSETYPLYQHVLSMDPGCFAARLGSVFSALPPVAQTEEEIDQSRVQYARALTELELWLEDASPKFKLHAAENIGVLQPFLLAYQNRDNRALQMQYGRLMTKLTTLLHSPAQSFSVQPAFLSGDSVPYHSVPRHLGPTRSRMRVGIVSCFYRHHSVWNAVMKGWVVHHNQEQIELIGYYSYNPFYQDDETTIAHKHLSVLKRQTGSFDAFTEEIQKDQLDFLIYPELGMDPVSFRLATMRLAARQAVGWGHPDTSGMPEIDMYLSGDLLEPEGAEHAYTERLIRLPNLGTCLFSYTVPLVQRTRSDFGLPEDALLFVCPHSLFKYTPEQDTVFVRIAQAFPHARFVFFDRDHGEVLTCFQKRLGRAFVQAGLNETKFFVFFRWLSLKQLRSLFCLADVFLDSIGFSGFNTALYAVAAPVPIVTQATDFMRGCLAAAVLRWIGCDRCVADSMERYIEIAIELAQNPALRQEIRDRMIHNEYRLYGDLEAVRGWERLILQG